MKIFCRNMILTALIILLGTTAACGVPPSRLPMPASSTASSNRLLKPENSIGNMVVTTGSREAPHILESCPFDPSMSAGFTIPGIATIDCRLPQYPQLAIGIPWYTADAALRESNWLALTWELYIDGQQVDLDAFGTYDIDLQLRGDFTKLRSWDVMLKPLTPGMHTLRSVIRLNQQITDGVTNLEAGTYEMIINFTVPESASAVATGTKFKVALVPGGPINDGTFHQITYEGLKRAEQELGIEIAYSESLNYEQSLELFASQGFNLIIGGSFFLSNAVEVAAKKHPDINYVIVDATYDPTIPNVRGLVFAEDEAGYLAGVLAALMSKNGIIGVVAGPEIPPVQRSVLGYESGAKSVNPDIQVKKVYVDSFHDPAGGAEVARAFISTGADIIFGAGAETGSGAIQSSAEAGVYVIGVDMDEYVTTFLNGAAPGSDRILSSARKRVDVAIFNVIKEALDGTFQGGTTIFNARAGGIDLAPFHESEGLISASIRKKLDDTLKGLIDGSIETNVTLP